MAEIAQSAVPVGSVYRALERRNRVVGFLRLVVPVLGLLVLASLSIQMLVASIGNEFTIGRVTIERDRLTVETPTYQGLLADGGAYDVTAQSAESALDRPTAIMLKGAKVVLNRPSGVQVTATAAEAELEVELQQVTATGLTDISDTTGMTAEVVGLHVDVLSQVATGGKTTIVYPGGETLEAEAMTYDARTEQWGFTGAVVTAPDLPDPPAEATP
jgi:lipopolysaccharide export system protein LptC